jgi:hypothetical protein
MKPILIKNIKQPYKEMALIEQEVQGFKRCEDKVLGEAFIWANSLCGYLFWEDVSIVNYPEITTEIETKFPSVFKDELIEKYKELNLSFILEGLELLKDEFEKDFDRELGFQFENKDAILRSPTRRNLLSVNNQIDIINEIINFKTK